MIKKYFAIILAVGLVSGNMSLMADPDDSGQPSDDQASAQAAAPAQAPAPMPPEQIETLVAPIALYPDPLISQILVASTYPLELVQAGQWLQQHPELQGQTLKDAAAQQSWDPSVQALVIFPDLIKRLNSDVTWTTNLGNAFLADQGSVMDTIQRMRIRAQDAGKLTSTPQEKVTTQTESGKPVVEIQPADPEVIYVPEYNPVWIWGSPVRYYYPSWYYPPPPPYGVWFLWGPAFRMSFYYPGWGISGGWGGWGWRAGWGNHAVIVNRTFITTNHYNVVHFNTVGGRAVWVHSPEHRMGVAYPNHVIAQRFAPGAGRPAFSRPTSMQVQAQFHQRAVGATDHIGNRAIMAGSANRSAFNGTEHGANARVYSNRGRSSLKGQKSPSKFKGGGKKDNGSGNGGGR